MALREIDGGPGYFSQFSNSLPSDPNYFPIGVWFESVTSQADINLDKAAGINLYVVLTGNSNLSLVQSNGMYAILQQNEWRTNQAAINNPAVVGWELADEIDMTQGPSQGYTSLTNILAGLPNDDRLRYNNYGKGVMFWETDAEAARFVNEFQQAISVDTYWFTDPNIHSQWEGGALLNGATRPLTYDETRLAANYGYTVDRMRELDAMDGERKPIWNFVEVGWPFTESAAQGGRAIQPEEIKAAVWHSIIAGAQGIIYFNHSFGGPDQTQHALRDPDYAAQRAAVTSTNALITQLAPVLNAPFDDGFVTASPSVRVMAKFYDGVHYVFAGSKENVASTATFTLPSVSGGTATVINEGRTISITGGQFLDNFANGNAIHIYQINPGGTPTPGAPTIGSFSTDSNVIGDGITNDNTLTLTGTAPANSTVTVFDGTNQIGTTTANGSGAWGFTTNPLPNGSHSFTVKATIGGTTGPASSPKVITVDTVAPSAPAITSFSSDNGTVGDGITSDTTLTLTGSAAANNAVKIYDGATLLGSTTANGSGAWSYTTVALTNRAHSLTARGMDSAGNTSAASAALVVTIDSTYDGGPGIDTLYLSSTTQGVVVNLSTAIENVVGGSGNDRIIGNAAVNRLAGGGGDDTLDGRGGADTTIGGTGNDISFVDRASDQVQEASGQGSDVVIATASYSLATGVSVELLRTASSSSTNLINLAGNEFANTLQGNAAANTLNGRGGVDTMSGFTGNDTYFVDNVRDRVNEAVGQGSDRIFVTGSYALPSGAEIERLATTGSSSTYVSFVGNGFAQTIQGNAAANSLHGAGGRDTLTGFGGNDLFRFSAALGASNVDTITDFNVLQDTIELQNSFFIGLATGTLVAGAFKTGATATQADDRIIYNSATGALFYDADGNGSGAAIQFAKLASNLALTNADFVVV